MRILYITMMNPAVDAILGGMREQELQGLPAMFFPFKMLLERGCEIDILLFTEAKKRVKESECFKEDNLICVPIKGGLSGKLAFPLIMHHAVRRVLNSKEYDFVYGMTEGSCIGIREASRRGIPCAIRQYGTQNLTNKIKKIRLKPIRRIYALTNNTYILLSMYGKMNFLLATNDGSCTDEINELLGVKRNFKLYHWRSGISIPKSFHAPDMVGERNYPNTYSECRLAHIGRITTIKRQDRSVEILHAMHEKGYKFHLHFIGEVCENEMIKALKSLIKQYHLEEYVHFEGAKSQSVCRLYARNSFAVFLLSDNNRGNVFYEALSEGAVILINNNSSVNDYVRDGENCIACSTYEEAANKLIQLLHDKTKVERIRREAYETAVNGFLSLEDRFGREVQLILDTASGKDTSDYPSVL